MQLKVLFENHKVACVQTFPLPQKKPGQQQSRAFLGVIFCVYTNVNNRDRTRAGY